jgi:hypothetical protein
MLLDICMTFIATTLLYGVLAYCAFRRVAKHLQGNADAIKQVSEHVFCPIFGRKPKS